MTKTPIETILKQFFLIPLAARHKIARMMLERNQKGFKISPPPLPPSADADPLPLPPPQPLSIVTADPDWGGRTKCQPDKMPTGHNANQRLAL